MAKYTPMMEQYFKIKEDYKHCLLFFRLGDFYELFFDDALIVSKELEITLTGRDCGQKEKAPMCGVPHHSADGYIARLIEKGYKVAICEQVENPKDVKGIVNREVVRVVTAGTVLDPNMLEEGINNYILCIYKDTSEIGMSYADITTGEFFTNSIKSEDEKKIIDEIARLNPKEIIVNDSFNLNDRIVEIFKTKPYVCDSWYFEINSANKKICDHFGVLNVSGFGIEDSKASIISSGALLTYLSEMQKSSLKHITSIKKYSNEKIMILDISSRQNLELTETLREREKKGSLLWVLDKTKTSIGARLIRKWIEQPLLDVVTINKRLDAVSELVNDVLLREELREILNTIYDIERLSSKFIYGTANARDMIMFCKSIQYLPSLKCMIQNCDSALISEMSRVFDDLQDIYNLVCNAVCEEPPVSIKEGGFIKTGYNEELDMLIEAKEKGTTWIMNMEQEERDKTGIKNLKIKFNKIFGYCIEVTNSYKNLVPEQYIRRQTLANAERYITPDLKKIEETILGADEKISELEFKIFSEIRIKIAEQVERIQLTSFIISTLDVIQSFATVADKQNYVRPEVNEGNEIHIKESRHPVVEILSKNGFVPNDVCLNSKDERVAIITGPNMAGKSTYMRQVALNVLMAQIGSFIPADFGKIGVVDRIFTRVGASDNLATGQSTFMVEMSEVANILNNATKNSLLILDEIGRGTSTFDGLSIAWSVLEYIANKIESKTLFATHYHELTELEGRISGIKNYCVKVEEQEDSIVFLRRIVLGSADKSYGTFVAKIAGLPQEVLNRSNEIMEVLDKSEITKYNKLKDKNNEVVDYGSNMHRNQTRNIINEILEIDVDLISPREALRMLCDLQDKTREFTKNDKTFRE